jgi:hypothetical protein
LRPVLAERGFRNILVVTSNFHTRRAKLVFVEVYRPRATIVHVSASPDLRFDPKTWWQTREGRKYLFLDLLKWLYAHWELWTLPDQEKQETRRSWGPARPATSNYCTVTVRLTLR